jgi:DNA-binding GntR family transcriptional regulator
MTTLKATFEHDPNLTTKVYQHLRQGLTAGRWQPGDRISGNVLARELGVSRTPVRDAMQQLASEGLVTLKAKSAAHVRQLSRRDLRDCLGVRLAMEPFAAARAASRLTRRDLGQLRRLCQAMRRRARAMADAQFHNAELNAAMQQDDAQFHRVILTAADNARLLRIIEDDRLLTRKAHYPSEYSIAHIARTLLQHWRILRALEQRDARAARRAMARHIRTATRAVFTRLEEARP